MARFTIWEGEGCGITLKLGDGPPLMPDGSPEDPAARMVLAFDARTWDAACQARNDHYGWGRYVPGDPGGGEDIGPDEP